MEKRNYGKLQFLMPNTDKYVTVKLEDKGDGVLTSIGKSPSCGFILKYTNAPDIAVKIEGRGTGILGEAWLVCFIPKQYRKEKALEIYLNDKPFTKDEIRLNHLDTFSVGALKSLKYLSPDSIPISQLEQVTTERDSLKNRVNELELQLKEKDLMVEMLKAQIEQLKKPTSPSSKLNASMNMPTPLASPLSSVASPNSPEKMMETVEEQSTKKRKQGEAKALLDEHRKLSPSLNKHKKAKKENDEEIVHRKDNWAAPQGSMRHRKTTSRLTYSDVANPESNRAAPVTKPVNNKKRGISPSSDSENSPNRKKFRRLRL